MIVLGIDIGTQGARVVACDAHGTLFGHAAESFPPDGHGTLPPGWAEQEPDRWWAALVDCLHQLVTGLRQQNISPDSIEALAVTSTSGTILPINEAGQPLRPALMYNDSRAAAEADVVQQAGAAQAARLGYRFTPSFALPKILWLHRHEPHLFEQTHRFIHAADFIVGRLSGEYGVTDFSNALKTGYDVQNKRWPPFIETSLGIPLTCLPAVVKPGTPIAQTAPACAAETGLPANIPILAGMTDGCTSQISTGAVSPGAWSSTLGTTLVLKGVTPDLITDPVGRIYSHRHPEGYWLPGGASNTGGEALARHFPQARWPALDEQALKLAPTEVILYPLARRGERFPFAQPEAEAFILNPSEDEATLYTAHLEGVGYVERLAYDTLTDLGADIGNRIYSAGGATHSRAWSQLRADILGRTLVRPKVTGGAIGAAIIAAAGCWYDGLIPAAQAMVRIVEQIAPRSSVAEVYAERYQRFCDACAARGYIPGGDKYSVNKVIGSLGMSF